MPNWCNNYATFSNPDSDKVQSLILAFESGNPFMTFMPPPKNEYDRAWCVENWGTKWDATYNDGEIYNQPDQHYVVIDFDTAWSPPVGFYRHLESQGWEVEATYHEPGMSFAGCYKDNEDNYYEYDFSDDNWRDNILDEEVMELLEMEYDTWLDQHESESIMDEA